MRLTMTIGSDLGLRRAHNEDCYGTWVPDDPAERERHGALLVVADGMGGSRAGEVASRLAVESVIRAYQAAAGQDPVADLAAALHAANHVVHGQSVNHPEMSGMGTTCTAAVVRRDELFLAHVGDSRAYLVRDGAIRQLTQDHSLVAQLVEHRHITPEQAKVDPRRNVVTRSVGVAPEVDVDGARLEDPLAAGDTLVLCTDGLHGLVEDAEIARLAGGADLERACGALIALANARGGPDNITVVLGRLEA